MTSYIIGGDYHDIYFALGVNKEAFAYLPDNISVIEAVTNIDEDKPLPLILTSNKKEMCAFSTSETRVILELAEAGKNIAVLPKELLEISNPETILGWLSPTQTLEYV